MSRRLARVGGALIIIGSVGVLIAEAMVLGGRSVAVGRWGVGELALRVGLLLGLGGTALLALTGQGPFAGKDTRTGLALVAVAMLGAWIVFLLPQSIDLLFVYLGIGVVAVLVGLVGVVLIGLALRHEDGAAGSASRLLLGGVALVPVIYGIGALGPSDARLTALTAPMGALAVLLLTAGMALVGYLALRDRWSWV